MRQHQSSKHVWRKKVRTLPWLGLTLVGVLILFDIIIHPLTAGPDRLVHDPAVYRLADPNYLPGDWYTGMAVKSGIYTFYAQLVNAYRLFHLPEELWRQLLYLASLATLFYALIRIARLFSKSALVIPIVAVLHMFILTGANQPVWVNGPFMQIDGGLAPRSIGNALSFLALLFLLRGSIIVPAAILGIATLIHASNSLIVFTLFLAAWLLQSWLKSKDGMRQRLFTIGRQAALALVVYLIAGGWFSLYVASRSISGAVDFPPEKFIWTWIYVRAPYHALPLAGQYWWVRLFAHVAAIVVGWFMLRSRVEANFRRALDILVLVGLGSVVYFFLFYLFAFVWPWLPGFQFYSIRVVYLVYFTAYLLISLSLLMVGREWMTKLFLWLGVNAKRYASAAVLAGVIVFLALLGARLGETYRKPKVQNLTGSWQRVLDNSVIFRSLVPEGARFSRPPQQATLQYLLSNPQPLLAPPDWPSLARFKSPHYLPAIVSFKSFGFTKEGLPEWFRRLNDVSQGEIQRIYETQVQAGRFEPVSLDWKTIYSGLSDQEVLTLASKYNFQLFLTYQHLSYSFQQIAEDDAFRLYQIPEVPQR